METVTGSMDMFREELEEADRAVLEAIAILQNARIVSEADGTSWEMAYTFSAAEKILKGARRCLDELGRLLEKEQ